MSDLALAPNSFDLDLTGNQLNLVTEVDKALAQRLQIKLSLQRGTWFVNLEAFVPWRELIFVRSPNLSLIRSLMVDLITNTPTVERVVEFTIDFDNPSGKLTMGFRTLTTAGEEVTVEGEAFCTASPLMTLILLPVGRII